MRDLITPITPTETLTHCRITREMEEKMVGGYNMCFWHPDGILNLGWCLKSRSPGTPMCCQQRHSAHTALQAALFGAT